MVPTRVVVEEKPQVGGTIEDDSVYVKKYLPRDVAQFKKLSIMLNQNSEYGLYEQYANQYIRGARDQKDGSRYIMQVSSPLLASHVAKSVNLAKAKGFVHPLIVEADGFSLDYEMMYHQARDLFEEEFSIFCKHVDCNDVVLFGRVESIVDYFSKRWLSEKGMNDDEIAKLFIDKEMQRLSPAYDRVDLVRERLPRKIFRDLIAEVPRLKFSVQRASGLNLSYKGRKIAVVERPWGRDMAYAFTKLILERSKPKEVLVVGGCGSIGGHNIDDVVVPNVIISPNDQYRLNGIGQSSLCYNVDSPLDENASFLENAVKPSVIEMESSGYLRALAGSGIPFRTALYVMDVPTNGITLGKTYYNQSFLEGLFSSKNRGKDRALEVLLTGI
jgi:hypothetical protein